MTFCVPLRGTPDVALQALGGKARSLLRLAAGGLTVPPALVIPAAVFQGLRAGGPALPASLRDQAALAAVERAAEALRAAPFPPGFEPELAAALEGLAPGGRFSVRSSAALEDRAGAAGAGVFLSRLDVPADQVAAAVRDVMAAALSPAAVAYALRRGLATDALAMSVLVHPFIPGDASGTAAFDPALQDAPLLEASGQITALTPAARATIAGAARWLAAAGSGVELEWVSRGDEVTFLQLRPYVAPTARAWAAAPELGDGEWTWDAAHNPWPLSPAHAELVALVDARCRTAFRQRVAGGYLFYAPTAGFTAPPVDPTQALRALTAEADRLLATPAPTLETALDTFAALYEPLFAVVQPTARAARAALTDFLRARGRADAAPALLRGVPSLATERARRAEAIAAAPAPEARAQAVARYLERFGDEAPVWDVAAPTYAEEPGLLERVRSRAAPVAPNATVEAQLDAALAPAERPEGQARLAAARLAVAVAEDDDLLYARAQAVVRRALLREGERLRAGNILARADDVFWLSLEATRRDARGDEPLTAAAATHAIAAARRAQERALADPPLLPQAPPADGPRTGTLRGRPASGGRAIGPVHVHRPGSRVPIPAGAILIARTLLPTELPLVSPGAIVVETGGVLGHVAAQARERDLPAIVDAAGACAAFRTGDRVLVDGDRGLVIRL